MLCKEHLVTQISNCCAKAKSYKNIEIKKEQPYKTLALNIVEEMMNMMNKLAINVVEKKWRDVCVQEK